MSPAATIDPAAPAAGSVAFLPGEALPRWRDPAVLLLLGCALALQAWVWRISAGYPLADAVEHMERAQWWVHGERLVSPDVLRSFAFSLLFAPLFAAAKALGIEDLRFLPYVAVGLQALFSLLLVLVCARLAARVAGRRAGLAAGWLVAVNPVLLVYSVTPVSGVLCALFIALALERLLEDGEVRRSLEAGLFLGLAFLVAYQALAVVAPIALLGAIRHGRRRWRCSAALLAGIGAALLVQVALDRWIYGSWGLTLSRYLLVNIGPQLTELCLKLGLRDLARTIYSATHEALGGQFDPALEGADTRQRMPRSWYLQNLPSFLLWPVLAITALGLLRAVLRPRWATSVALLTLALNVAAMSVKGSKSFRLWLPLLPLFALLAAQGWDWLVRAGGGRTRAGRLALGAAALLAALPLTLRELRGQGLRLHGGYWEAIEWLEREGLEPGETARVASAYHWAVYLRASPRVEIVKPPMDLWEMGKHPPGSEARETVNETVKTALAAVDWLIAHHAAIGNSPHFFRWVVEHFELRALFYDQTEYGWLGPIYVLKRIDPESPGRRFFQLHKGADPYVFVRQRNLSRPLRFSGGEQGAESLILLGWEYEPLAGSGWGWITYHWLVETPLSRQWFVHDLLLDGERAKGWYNDHRLAYGALAPAELEPGAILTESYVLVPGERAFQPGEPFQPLGGSWRRGDLMPVSLWMSVDYRDSRSRTLVELEPSRPGASAPLRATIPPDTKWSARGERAWPTLEGRVQVGGMFLPVHPRARLPDDGRPVRG